MICNGDDDSSRSNSQSAKIENHKKGILYIKISFASLMLVGWLSSYRKNFHNSVRNLSAMNIVEGTSNTVRYQNNCKLKRETFPSVTIEAKFDCKGGDQDASIAFDILSIGSKTRFRYMTTQLHTWASHPAVRNFWGVTEDDDSYPMCLGKDAETRAEEYINFCKNEKTSDNIIKKTFQFWHADATSFKEDGINNHCGWLAAQRRSVQSLGKRLKEYKKQEAQYGTIILPDYLLVVDDDSFVNMDLLYSFMKEKDPLIPQIHAGCLLKVNYPEPDFMWTFPWGGFGLILNRESIARLIRPLNCGNQVSRDPKWTDFETKACTMLEENNIDEKDFFYQGMTLGDLMFAYSLKKDYCMHSDWMTGYFGSNFFLSKDDHGDSFNLLDYFSSENCASAADDGSKLRCTVTSRVCHKQNPESMRRTMVEILSSLRI